MSALWLQQASLLSGLICSLGLLGAWEKSRHQKRLHSIPLRIHVNGTRGKSSTTRLMAAALRASGKTTVGKTTGSLPRLLLPDGLELDIVRHGRANVIEQRDTVAEAARLGAQAIVIECMALRPPLQWLCEKELVHGTHAIITNVRPDHLDVMGPDDLGVARALCGMVPVGGMLVTGEKKHLDVLAFAANDRGSRLLFVGEPPNLLPANVEVSKVPPPTDAEMAGFAYTEHKDNVHAALALGDVLGVDRQVALSGMHGATPDVGALSTFEIDYFGRKLCFVNAFAANDPFSTGLIWHDMLTRFSHYGRPIALINCREDRPERSMQLAQALPAWREAERIVLMGKGTHVFSRLAQGLGISRGRLLDMGDAPARTVLEALIACTEESSLVVGMGNIGGEGLSLVRLCRNRSAPTQRSQ